MGDIMSFPKTAEEFINDYKFKDRFEVYTNGSDLIPVFRVKQMIEHYGATAAKVKCGKNVTEAHPVDEFICSECGAIFRDVPLIVIDEDDGDEYYYEFTFKYCPRCGAKIDTE